MDSDQADAAALARALLPRLRRWDAARWSVRVAGRVRADVAAEAVQRLADADADAEGEPRRPVPRLADTSLADQLTVVVEDGLRTGDPAALRTVAAELGALRAALGLR
jgi:hypothetical protein